VGSQRLRAAAAKGDVLDERLWMKVARITGAPMNTTALVGTASQVARALLAYYDLGFTSLLLRGFDPLDDIAGLADVVELVKAGAADRDSGGRGRASSSGAGFQVG
jgi:alkanesulfonate monooxygenase